MPSSHDHIEEKYSTSLVSCNFARKFRTDDQDSNTFKSLCEEVCKPNDGNNDYLKNESEMEWEKQLQGL